MEGKCFQIDIFKHQFITCCHNITCFLSFVIYLSNLQPNLAKTSCEWLPIHLLQKIGKKKRKKCILDLQLFNFSIWERKLSLDAHVNKLKKRQLIILTSGNYNFFRDDEGTQCQKKGQKTHNGNKELCSCVTFISLVDPRTFFCVLNNYLE